MTQQRHERVFCGRQGSPGFASGHVFLVAGATGAHADRPAGSPSEERALFETALTRAIEQLETISDGVDELGSEILEFQLALLEDDDLVDPVRDSIDAGTQAASAWRKRLDDEIDDYRAADDEYMAARAADLGDLRNRVLRNISGDSGQLQVPPGATLVADDMTPSEFLTLDWSQIRGAALRSGSPTSHVSILARSRNVPMVVELGSEADPAAGEIALLDAQSGRLVVSPSDGTQRQFDALKASSLQEAAEADKLKLKPAMTAVGRAIRIMINVNEISELDGISPEFCDGIGLVRTEFLFSKGPPGEDAQLAAYRKVVDWARGRPVTIRTLDAGGDKPIPGITIDGESNPFLGIRGVRLSLRNTDVFRVQLRALARAAAAGPLKVMVPMVSIPAELEAVRKLLDTVVSELAAEGLEHDRPALGMMVEVPAAALIAEDFDTDFYSIGTNDLIQYTMAVARDVSGLSDLTDGDLPAVIRLIGMTADAARDKGAELSVCGDLASRPEYVPALLAAGVETLSASPTSVARVKLAVSRAGTTGR
jgi:phosphotransferase system enzyme I (PtsI)